MRALLTNIAFISIENIVYERVIDLIGTMYNFLRIKKLRVNGFKMFRGLEKEIKKTNHEKLKI